MGSLDPFFGCGVYVIYYHGPHPLYSKIADPNLGTPIYNGSAIETGGRKGSVMLEEDDDGERPPGLELLDRLRDHQFSIQQVGRIDPGLELSHFSCRYLPTEPTFIERAEVLIRNRFMPIWNIHVDGFGNKDPGAGRYDGAKPDWDELHPGRYWAPRLRKPAKRSRVEIEEAIKAHLESYRPPRDPTVV